MSQPISFINAAKTFETSNHCECFLRKSGFLIIIARDNRFLTGFPELEGVMIILKENEDGEPGSKNS